MALTTRTVAGILKDANGTALSGVTMTFTPSQPFGAGGTFILPNTETITTDGSGNYTITLQTTDDVGSYVPYDCVIGGIRVSFNLAAGSSTSLDALLS